MSTFNKANGYPADADVIYGDTDSIMIHTASTDLEAVTRMGHAIKKEVGWGMVRGGGAVSLVPSNEAFERMPVQVSPP